MQFEEGDMILWRGTNHSNDAPDIGWVIQTQVDKGRERVTICWLSNNLHHRHWADWLNGKNIEIIKGGHDD